MTISELLSLLASGFATVLTFYFWLVKSRKERPSLKAHLAKPFRSRSVRDWVGYHKEPRGSTCFEMKTIIANYSTYPNAIVGLRGWLKGIDGRWHEITMRLGRKAQGEGDELPINIPALQAIFLDAYVMAPLPVSRWDDPDGIWSEEEKDEDRLGRQAHAAAIADPMEIKLEITAVGGKKFTDRLIEAARTTPPAPAPVAGPAKAPAVTPAPAKTTAPPVAAPKTPVAAASPEVNETPSTPAKAPGDLRKWETQVGKELLFELTGQIGGAIYGTDVYTSDSQLATAAVHAGALQPDETGVVRVRIVPVLPRYNGSIRNGVTSSNWEQPWHGAYQVERV